MKDVLMPLEIETYTHTQFLSPFLENFAVFQITVCLAFDCALK